MHLIVLKEIYGVYSVGELGNIDVDSTHHLGNDELMVKVGRFLDESDEPGVFELD